MENTLCKIVLVAPEIPGNTGSVGRTCVALDAELILIEPIAFDISEKAVRRAGLDYWKHVKIKTYPSYEAFIQGERPPENKLFLFTRFAEKSYYQAGFTQGCYLVFGQETKGLSDDILKKHPGRGFLIPTRSEHIRSLNLANAATAVALEAQRQIFHAH